MMEIEIRVNSGKYLIPENKKAGPLWGPAFLFGSGDVIALAAIAAQLCRPAAPASECAVPTVLTRVHLK